jgi:hypothetical protein
MKKLLFLSIVFIGLFIGPNSFVHAQGVGINPAGNPPNSTAGLDVDFSDKGMLVPRMTTSQRDAIVNPALGLLIFNTSTACFNMWTGVSWKQVCGECDFNAPVAGSNSPICTGQTLNLSATSIAGASYQWSGPDGFVSAQQNPSISNASTLASGSYTVIATRNGCSSAPQSTVVTVNVPPVSTFSNSSPLWPNTSIAFTATATSGVVYNWSFPGGTPSTSSDQNPVVSWTTAGVKNVSLTVTSLANSCASSTTSPITITSPTVISFTNVGTTSWTAPEGVTSVEVLVVAGGGGGHTIGGGGGGGGVVYNPSFAVIPGSSYSVTVGNGGAVYTGGNEADGFPGGNSIFSTITAAGGGRSGGPGGSGGGGFRTGTGFGLGTPGQGNNGGTGGNNDNSGGGGGGAATAGGTGTGTTGGNGGNGFVSTITGTPVAYGGGGGGGTRGGIGGVGGLGGGGSAPNTSGNGGAGVPNTGGGGASGSFNGSYFIGGVGGSGIVILRY